MNACRLVGLVATSPSKKNKGLCGHTPKLNEYKRNEFLSCWCCHRRWTKPNEGKKPSRRRSGTRGEEKSPAINHPLVGFLGASLARTGNIVNSCSTPKTFPPRLVTHLVQRCHMP
ncbi:hypothetical protein L596_012048 [Steinernema carpocapsae]|uniref:Uncharacterized protein n=1 Tax=Steinernema carpocapsae TaxID=34508 RepID=A0A4U5NVX9_STECR|nr:hypothetical protein L596_012048 [Steinernema carpocapsae]